MARFTVDMAKLPTPADARRRAGKSMRRVAKDAGIGLQTVFRSEHRGAWPQRIDILEKYLRAVGQIR